MNETISELHLVDWDSAFFGIRIGRLTTKRLTADLIELVSSWGKSNQINCLYFLADAADPETSRLACEYNFQFIDGRITFKLQIDRAPVISKPASFVVRYARKKDLAVLQEMAGRLHGDSRFFFDRNFDRDKVSQMYGIWIEKACNSQDCLVLVGENYGRICGYIACRKSEENTGWIDLIAVDTIAQGKGFGKGLVLGALRWFRDEESSTIYVATQARNTRAQQLYQRCGFTTDSVENWYHHWFR